MNNKMCLLWGLAMGLCSVMAHAEIIGNAGAKQLQNEAVALLAQADISSQSSQQFLQRNHFDTDGVQWQYNGQVMHGPYYIPDGDEEGEAVPYVFAYNQNRSIVGIGGWLPAPLLKRLQAEPNVRCQKFTKEYALWSCAHSSATAQTQKTFMRDLKYLADNSN